LVKAVDLLEVACGCPQDEQKNKQTFTVLDMSALFSHQVMTK